MENGVLKDEDRSRDNRNARSVAEGGTAEAARYDRARKGDNSSPAPRMTKLRSPPRWHWQTDEALAE